MGSVEGTVRGTVHESAHHVVGWGQATGPRPHHRLFSLARQWGKKALACRTQVLSHHWQVHSQAANIDGVTCVFNFESQCLSNEVVYLANIDGVTCVFNFESQCLSNDARAFIVFNF